MNRSTFVVAGGQLRKFQAYMLLALKQEKIRVNHQRASDAELEITGHKGNQIVYFLFEQITSIIPLSELFGWAVRVEVTINSVGSDDQGNHKIELRCDPASNELNPIAAQMEQYETQSMLESAGEEAKCREVFSALSSRIMRSSYTLS